MSNVPYLRTEFKLSAHVKHRQSGQTTIFKDVVSIASTFALNSIPTCTLQLATGKEVSGANKTATIHDALDKLEPRDRVVVKLEIIRKDEDGRTDDPVIVSGLKTGKYIIFDGYYAGIGYQRSNNNATYTMHLVHWLDDLNCSSIINGDWSPGAPSDLAQCASRLALSALTGGSQAAANKSADGAIATNTVDIYRDGANNIIGPAKMEDDLWEKVIKEIFLRFGKLNLPLFQKESGQVSEEEDPPTGLEDVVSPPVRGWKPNNNNAAAIGALNRMPGKAEELDPQFRAKLPLDLTGLNNGEPATMLTLCAHDGICRIISNGIGHNTFWSSLVGEIAPSFLFAVSPSVEFAQVIPFFPGLHKEYVTITGEEYNYANFNANCATMLNQIVVFYPSQSTSGAAMGGKINPVLSYNNPVGFYPNKTELDHHWGVKLCRHPPSWLRNVSPSPAWVRDTVLHAPAGSAVDPGNGNETNAELKMRPEEATDVVHTKTSTVDGKALNVFSRFAAHWYKSAILGQRYGELSGKLRFDIAPGSILKIDPPITAIGKEKKAMFGAVVQVSYVIDAEQHSAGTSFSLSHLRTEDENDINKTVNKTHFVGTRAPLYSEKEGSPWPGGPLVVGQEPETE